MKELLEGTREKAVENCALKSAYTTVRTRIVVRLNSLTAHGCSGRDFSFRVKPGGEDTYAGVSRARESIFAVGTSLQVARGDARARAIGLPVLGLGDRGHPRVPAGSVAGPYEQPPSH